MSAPDRAFGLPPAIRFGFWMLGSCIAFAALLGLVRHLTEAHGMHVLVVSFWRNLLSILIFVPWLARNGIAAARSSSHGLLWLRALFMVLSSTSMFFAAALMPIAEATALSFTTPLFCVILAVLLLGERIGPRRIAALAVGMIGVAIILRPGAAAFDPAAFFPIFSAFTFGLVIITSKLLASRDSPEAIGFYLALYMIPISFAPALFVWDWPDWRNLGWLLGIGAAAAGNMYCISRALRLGDASQTAPYDFARLPFVALVGYLFFAQGLTLWVWIGAAVIMASVLYVTWREARAPAPAPAAAEERGTL